MVMRYAVQGNLRHYLSNNFINLTWNEKIELFGNIVKELKEIHDAGLVHCNFHSGNILIHEDLVYITDLEMYHFANKPKDSSYCLKTKKPNIYPAKSVLANFNIVHPRAFYTSRLLDFPNPQNSDDDYVLSCPTSEDEIEEINMLD
ncbi:serine/threonine protein kinase [Gigaspora margarita]|uniref:Serine/threonine protein kinase n=1 Tax=Gigaspora margarita TaxID=4874 RepID=A0A8H4EJY4_GIGMA|nr:serine/threonine protein kinase [Gigaspora margarita]